MRDQGDKEVVEADESITDTSVVDSRKDSLAKILSKFGVEEDSLIDAVVALGEGTQ